MCLFLPFKISYVVAGVVLMVVYKAADRVIGVGVKGLRVRW
jgi:ABC-type sulfate transport system permease subunit